MHFPFVCALLPLTAHGANLILSNDDGWAEINVRTFYNSLTAAGESVILSAPTENQSGTGKPLFPSDSNGSGNICTEHLTASIRLLRQDPNDPDERLRVQQLSRRQPSRRFQLLQPTSQLCELVSRHSDRIRDQHLGAKVLRRSPSPRSHRSKRRLYVKNPLYLFLLVLPLPLVSHSPLLSTPSTITNKPPLPFP